MKKITFTLVCFFFINNIFSQEKINYAEDQLILKFKSETNFDIYNCIVEQKFSNALLDLLNEKYLVSKIKLIGNKKTKRTYLLRFKEKQNIKHLIEVYKKTELFEYVEPNYIGEGAGKQACLETIPNDTYFSRQYGLYNDGTFTLSNATDDADIDMELAWDIEQGDPSLIVAVLDSGVKMDHPEFSGRIWTNADENSNGADSDDNGYSDDIEGWDFANNDNDPTDDHGHGTNVTGIVGANADNNTGYAGVDWNCKLMNCKILDSNNSGFYSWWTDAIYYAVNNGAKVLNMSVGGSGYSESMKEAVNYAFENNVTIVVSMMNFNNDEPYYPASYQNTIAVGSTNADDDRSSPFFWSATSGSNYGTHIDVVAPGNFIYGLSHQSNTNYSSYWGGTSQAAPLVTGLCALLLAQDNTRTPSELRSMIRSTAEDQVGNNTEDVSGFDVYFGYGRINAHQALLQDPAAANDLENKRSTFTVFPNPATEDLFISGNLNKKIITIVNVLGLVVFEEKITNESNSLTVDVSKFSKGIYFVRVGSKNKKGRTEKIMIK